MTELKKLREKKGLKQEALAERCGISASYLSQIETGKGHLYLTTAEEIARELDTTVAKLFQSITTAILEARPEK